MIHGAKLGEMVGTDSSLFKSYNHCIAQAICNPPQPKCYLNNCNECPGVMRLKACLLMRMQLTISHISSGLMLAGTNLKRLCQTVEDFVEA